MQTFLSYDRALFLFINHLPHTAFTDAVAMALSGIGTAGVVWFFLAIVLFVREERRDHWFFLSSLVAAAVSFVGVDIGLKLLFFRNRPPVSLGAIILGGQAAGYSFPSSHATASFAMATVLASKERQWAWGLYGLAALISFSRIYLGQHYPIDVLAGTFFGLVIGRVAIAVEQWAVGRFRHLRSKV